MTTREKAIEFLRIAESGISTDDLNEGIDYLKKAMEVLGNLETQLSNVSSKIDELEKIGEHWNVKHELTQAHDKLEILSSVI